MKSLIIVATLAASVLTIAPVNAGAFKAGLHGTDATTVVERRGRGCDTAQDLGEKPRCTR